MAYSKIFVVFYYFLVPSNLKAILQGNPQNKCPTTTINYKLQLHTAKQNE